MGTTANARIAIVDHLRRSFLGDFYDQTDYCPIAPPLIQWDRSNPDDTDPFTPDEVLQDTGYLGLLLDERNREFAKELSGLMTISGSQRIVKSYYIYLEARHVLNVPGSSPISKIERYADRVMETWSGTILTYHDEFSDSDLKIIHWPGRFPDRVSEIGSTGDWIQQVVTITLRQRIILPQRQ